MTEAKQMMDSETRISPARTELGYSLELDGEKITVETSEEELKRNLLAAALKQNISEADAKKTIDNTTFTMSSWNEFISNLESLPSFLKPLFKILQHQALATVYTKPDGTYQCHFNIEYILRLVTLREILGIKERFHELPQEVQVLTITELMNQLWKHERQHLIQYMNPKTKAEMDKSLKMSSRIRKIALAVIAVTTPITVISMQSLTIQGAVYTLVSGGATTTAMLTALASEYIFSRQTHHEKEAYEKMKKEEPSTSPFRVSID